MICNIIMMYRLYGFRRLEKMACMDDASVERRQVVVIRLCHQSYQSLRSRGTGSNLPCAKPFETAACIS